MKHKYIATLLFIIFCVGIIGCSHRTYKDPNGAYTIKLPSNWREIMPGAFTPFSKKEDTSQTMLHIIVSKTQPRPLSKGDQEFFISQLKNMEETILTRQNRKVDGVEALDLQILNTNFGPKRYIHQVMFAHDGSLHNFSLTTSPERFIDENSKFEKMISSLKIRKK